MSLFGKKKVVKIGNKELQVMVEELLSCADGVAALSRFLKKEFSHENLEFLLCVRQLNPQLCAGSLFVPKMIGADSDTEMEKIEYIYGKFILAGSRSVINIPGYQTKKLGDLHDKGELRADSFGAAYKEIFQLVVGDSFTRFRHTDEYKAFVKKLHPYKVIRD